MLSARERSLILYFLISDLILLNSSLAFLAGVHYINFWDSLQPFILLNICWFITYLFFINERLFVKKSLFIRFREHAIKFGVYLGIASFLIVLFDFDDLSRFIFFGSTILFFVLHYAISFWHDILIKKRKKGQYYSNVLILGNNESAVEVFKFYRDNPDMGKIVGCLGDEPAGEKRLKELGSIAQLEEMIIKHNCNEVIITLQLTKEKKIKELIDKAEKHGVRPRVVPNYYAMFRRAYEVQSLGKIPILNIREVPIEKYANRFWKRAFDVAFSSAIIILTSPIMLLIAIAIKIESKGPVFYRPLRTGRKSSSFRVYKFRSMRENDDPLHGTKSTVKDDPRVTRVGRFIRKTNLDELPQFFNVLKNQMSVVGPRPHRTNLNRQFQERMSTFMVRHYIKPGITGWAQVNGWRGPTNTKLEYMGRALHDLWYLENWTFTLDLYIIYLTLFGKKVKTNAF